MLGSRKEISKLLAPIPNKTCILFQKLVESDQENNATARGFMMHLSDVCSIKRRKIDMVAAVSSRLALSNFDRLIEKLPSLSYEKDKGLIPIFEKVDILRKISPRLNLLAWGEHY